MSRPIIHPLSPSWELYFDQGVQIQLLTSRIRSCMTLDLPHKQCCTCYLRFQSLIILMFLAAFSFRTVRAAAVFL